MGLEQISLPALSADNARSRRGPEVSSLTPEEIRRIVLEILG
jgi:hypothetical protein